MLFPLLRLLFLIESLVECVSYVSVQTTNGVIQGKRVDYGSNTNSLYYGKADVFLGIPYAQPPVRERRFAQAESPLPSTTSVYNATYFRPKCIQGDGSGGNTSEDCLYLNVFCQNAANSTAMAAVMVFIDGANGLNNGGVDENQMKGIVRNLVVRGVIVVTMQYRLGAFGFFSSESMQIPRNLGMLDQVKALQWVNTNIASFGGDPQKVTLAGQGDGACAVSAHTLSPMSQNLFQKAIIQSGTIHECYSPTTNYNGVNANYLNRGNENQNVNALQYDAGLPYSQWNENDSPATTAHPFDYTTTGVPVGNSRGSLFEQNVTNPSQLLTMKLCNVTAEEWRTGNLPNLTNCLHNFTVDVFSKTDGIHNVTWMIVRDNLFLNDSIENLVRRRPPIPIIIGTVQDENADYAFKLVSNAASSNKTEGDVFNDWFVDFAKRNKVNGSAAEQIKNIISSNYNVSDGTSISQKTNGDTHDNSATQFGNSQPQFGNGNEMGIQNASDNRYSTQRSDSDNPRQPFPVNQNANGRQYDQSVPIVALQDAKGNVNVTAVFHTLQVITKISSDATTVSQTAVEIDAWVANGNRYVHVYQFNHMSKLGADEMRSKMVKGWEPVSKGQDQVFLFMTESVWTRQKPTSEDKKMADEMGRKWTDFAKEGTVAGWNPVTTQRQYDPTTSPHVATPAPGTSRNVPYCSLTSQPSMQVGYGNQAKQVFNEQVNPIVKQSNAPQANQPPSAQQQSFSPSAANVRTSSNGGSSWSMSFNVNNLNLPYFGK